MNDNRTNELDEKYEDALIALVVDEYAKENGCRVLDEFEDAEKCGAIPEMLAGLDRKCRDLIRHTYAKQHFCAYMKAITRPVRRVASIALVIIGICSVLIASVEAIRTLIIDFFIMQHEKYSTITFDTTNPQCTVQAASPTTTDRSEDPLVGMIPSDYHLEQLYDHATGDFTSVIMALAAAAYTVFVLRDMSMTQMGQSLN